MLVFYLTVVVVLTDVSFSHFPRKHNSSNAFLFVVDTLQNPKKGIILQINNQQFLKATNLKQVLI